MIDWKDITDKNSPEEGVLLLAKGVSKYNGLDEDYAVGYWHEEENGLTQYKDVGSGWKYSFTHWIYAKELF